MPARKRTDKNHSTSKRSRVHTPDETPSESLYEVIGRQFLGADPENHTDGNSITINMETWTQIMKRIADSEKTNAARISNSQFSTESEIDGISTQTSEDPPVIPTPNANTTTPPSSSIPLIEPELDISIPKYHKIDSVQAAKYTSKLAVLKKDNWDTWYQHVRTLLMSLQLPFFLQPNIESHPEDIPYQESALSWWSAILGYTVDYGSFSFLTELMDPREAYRRLHDHHYKTKHSGYVESLQTKFYTLRYHDFRLKGIYSFVDLVKGIQKQLQKLGHQQFDDLIVGRRIISALPSSIHLYAILKERLRTKSDDEVQNSDYLVQEIAEFESENNLQKYDDGGAVKAAAEKTYYTQNPGWQKLSNPGFRARGRVRGRFHHRGRGRGRHYNSGFRGNPGYRGNSGRSRGYSRGRGRGRGRRGRTCYRCGYIGHMSYDCSLPYEAGNQGHSGGSSTGWNSQQTPRPSTGQGVESWVGFANQHTGSENVSSDHQNPNSSSILPTMGSSGSVSSGNRK